MSSFSKLSIELIQRILTLTFTSPDAFNNAAATCKLFYTASRALVDQYKKVNRFQDFRYSRHTSELACKAADLPGGVFLRCKNPQHWDESTAVSGIKIMDAIGLLQTIAREPRIARFIQSLDLKDPNRHLSRQEGLNPFLQASRHDRREIYQLWREVIPSNSEMGERNFAYWKENMTPFLADVLILNLLPNVEEIALSKSWGRTDIVNNANLELLDAMVVRANNPAIRNAPLARLAVVKPYIGHGWAATGSLTPLASFLALNSLREFYMGGVHAFSDDVTHVPFTPRHTVYGNSLRKIELNGSAIGPRALSALLSRTPHLECLHLSLETKPRQYGMRYNIGHLLAIIAEHIGDTLKHLALRTNPIDANTYTLTDMHGFRQLQSLELDVQALCAPAFYASEFLPSGRLDQYHPNFRADPSQALPQLVDLLPHSLVTLRVNFNSVRQTSRGEYDFFKLRRMLAFSREERNRKLPNLRDVLFDPPSDLETFAGNYSSPEFDDEIRSILGRIEACGIKWEGGIFEAFNTFNDRFDVKDAQYDQ